jgi:hypothetical protein
MAGGEVANPNLYEAVLHRATPAHAEVVQVDLNDFPRANQLPRSFLEIFLPNH